MNCVYLRLRAPEAVPRHRARDLADDLQWDRDMEMCAEYRGRILKDQCINLGFTFTFAFVARKQQADPCGATPNTSLILPLSPNFGQLFSETETVDIPIMDGTPWSDPRIPRQCCASLIFHRYVRSS